MLTLSPVPGTLQHELWLFTPDGQFGPLAECGLFDTRAAAERVASLLLDWFYIAVWASPLDDLNPDFQDELWFRRKGLRALGADLAAVYVEVREVAPVRVGREVRTFLDRSTDDGSEDDTLLAPPDHVYEVIDGRLEPG